MKSCSLYFVLAFCLLFSTPQIRAQSRESNLLLPGATVAQAEQALLKVLQDVADANQVELIQKTKQPDQQVLQDLTKVTIQLETNCSFDQLVRFLDAIMSYERFLRVDELSIVSLRIQGKWEIRPSLKVAGFFENAPDEVPAKTQNLEKTVDADRAPLFRRDQNLEILQELTRLLPINAVLTTYRNRDCTIQLGGLFPSSSDLMEKLEKSPFLKDVTFVGSIYRDPRTGGERASLSAKCKK
jgi:Tfp pilus assembly protein PilN